MLRQRDAQNGRAEQANQGKPEGTQVTPLATITAMVSAQGGKAVPDQGRKSQVDHSQTVAQRSPLRSPSPGRQVHNIRVRMKPLAARTSDWHHSIGTEHRMATVRARARWMTPGPLLTLPNGMGADSTVVDVLRTVDLPEPGVPVPGGGAACIRPEPRGPRDAAFPCEWRS
jgi:hypothetical protein